MKIETEYPYSKTLPFDVPKTVCKLDVSYGENVGNDNCWDKEIYQEIEICGFIACTKENGERVLLPCFSSKDNNGDLLLTPIRDFCGHESVWIEFYETKEEAKSHYNEFFRRAIKEHELRLKETEV